MATEPDIDPKYECDAPLYVDFEQLKQNGGLEDDGADSWFGKFVIIRSTDTFKLQNVKRMNLKL